MVKPSSVLETLHQSVGDILQEYGVVLESRPFKPHITLMRFSEPYNEEISRAMLRAQIISTRFMADRFVLYSVDRALAIPYLKQQEYRF
jgi:2'-5' RNA ligase